MEQINSFGDAKLRLNEAALAQHGIAEFFNASTDEMKAQLVELFRGFGEYADSDNIVMGSSVRPMMTLRACGWSDEHILKLDTFGLFLASKVKYSHDEFEYWITKLGITSKIREDLAVQMLKRKSDAFECILVDEFPEYKTYLNAMHPTISKDVTAAQKLLRMAYIDSPAEWYLGMLANVDSEILERLLKFQAPFTLAIATLPLLEGKNISCASFHYEKWSSIFWVHIDTKNLRCSIPIYRWEKLWGVYKELDAHNLHSHYSDTDLYLYDEHLAVYDYGLIKSEGKDPVLTFADKMLANIKLDPQSFTEDEKYSNVVFALKEMLNGRRDWYLSLKYPRIFEAFGGFNRKVSIAMIIKALIPKEYCKNVPDLCTGLIQIGDSIMTIYVGFASDAIQHALDRGEVINVGCSSEKELSFNEYAADFINWVQQADRK